MNKRVQSSLWCAAGFFLLAFALLLPGHFRAIDRKALEYSAKGYPTLAQFGLELINLEQVGPARVIYRAAQALNLPSADQLGTALAPLTKPAPIRSANAGPDLQMAVPEFFQSGLSRSAMDVLLEKGTREKVLAILETSRRPGVREIIQNRTLTNTVEFAPATSVAGQPLDASIVLLGLLSQTDRLSPSLRETVEASALQSNTNGNLGKFEAVYLDLLALGQKLDWQQLSELTRRIETTATFHRMAEEARGSEDNLSLLYAAALLSERPERLNEYLAKFPESGMRDVQTALSYGKGSLRELLLRQVRVYAPRWRMWLVNYDPFASIFYAVVPSSLAAPVGTAIFRWLLFLSAAFCYARAIGTMVFPWETEDESSVDTARLAQEITVALCIFVVTAVLSEPYLGGGIPRKPSNQVTGFRIPGITASQRAPKPTSQPVTMSTILPLLIFFVLQALIYIWCLTKLAEIRHQELEPRIKLRLLENEDHLFDAGLYLGFAGTVISLILVSLGIISQSIMAAYASTSFGIIFVSILKICHIRPLRRQLIMESESERESAPVAS